jgi:hypothetical protein
MGVTELRQLTAFLEFAKANYPDCTLEQKLGAYMQHHPVRAMPFLLELLVEFEPDLTARGYFFPPKPKDSDESSQICRPDDS